MNSELEIFLESDLLEKYLLGETNTLETARVEHFINKYPEAKAMYRELENNLEGYTKTFAVKAPTDVKQRVLKLVSEETVKLITPAKKSSWFYVAASVAALLFCAASTYLFNQNKFLEAQNFNFATEIKNLKNDLVFTNANLEDMKSKYALLNNPETQKYVMNGNQRAKKLKTVAYINAKERLSLINVVSLPELDEEQVFQMWANVNGKMVSLGTLEKADKKLLALPYQENMSSYNITIEPKGYKGQATVENMVATIDFNQ